MALFHGKYTRGTLRVPSPQWAGVSTVVRFDYTFTSAPALNDIVEIGILPAHCSVVDMTLIADDLDTNASPTIALDVGIMSGSPGEALNSDASARTCGSEFFAADQAARTGAVSRMSKNSGFRVATTTDHRSIGVKIQTAAATWANGTISLVVQYATNPAG